MTFVAIFGQCQTIVTFNRTNSHPSNLFRCKLMYLSIHMYMTDAALGDIHFISQTHEEKAHNELIMTHVLPL